VDTIRVAHPSPARTTQDSIERECFVCYEGLVFLGFFVEDPDTGDEVEVTEAVPCRRCAARALG